MKIKRIKKDWMENLAGHKVHDAKKNNAMFGKYETDGREYVTESNTREGQEERRQWSEGGKGHVRRDTEQSLEKLRWKKSKLEWNKDEDLDPPSWKRKTSY